MDPPSEGIPFLVERIDGLERERDALLEKSQRLEVLQRSFVDIIAAANEAALASVTLRGAWLGLGFSRALWFRIEAPQTLAAFYEIDGEGVRESEYGGTLPPASSLYRITSGDSDVATGWAGDFDAPLFDTRRRYAAAAVRTKGGQDFLLYVDGSNERSGSAWSVASLQELATHASFALDRMRMSGELERLAMHDPLTGLYNRRALMERLAAEMRTVKRTAETLAFAMIDLDDFKRINDTRGHAAGDAALIGVAHTLRTQTRAIDIPARFAGDEFSLIMPRTNRHAAQAVLERVMIALRTQGLSASIGVGFTVLGMDEGGLMRQADEAVYAAKAAGKNCYRFADDS
jgi:diguanylate cyclase (GGDEF)-like protein